MSLDNLNKPLVSICCQTFNHENYIRQCLDGFVMQVTDFPFEILIHDDASTDKTVEIIKGYELKYPGKMKVIYQKDNQMSKGVNPLTELLIPKAQGKYIALCEGDDYWIDSFKLQMQVDFLEKYSEYGLVHTEVNQYYEKTKELILNFNKHYKKYIPTGEIFEYLLIPGVYIIKTPSVIFRKNLYDEVINYRDTVNKGIPFMDLFIWLSLSRQSKIGYIDEPTTVYRVLENSYSNFSDYEKAYNFAENVFKIRKYFIENYDCSKSIKKIYNTELIKMRLLYAYRLKNNEMANKEFRKFITFFYNYNLKDFIKLVLYFLGAKNVILRKLIDKTRIAE